MSRILRSILAGVWAIDRDHGTALMPQVFSILQGKAEQPSKEAVAAYRANLQPVMYDEPGCDDGTKGGTQQPTTSSGSARVVMVLPIKDVLYKYDQNCGPYGVESYVQWLDQAAGDGNVAGVVLDIDGPGGEGAAMRWMADALKNFPKPVVSIVRHGMACSAAYGIAAHTREVYASGGQDVFGSVGTYMTIADMYGYYAKEGLKMEDVYATLSTDKNGPFRAAIAGNTERLIKEVIDPFNEGFIAAVKAARPQLAATEAQWNNGRTMFAPEAIAVGLIDGYNTLEGAIARVRALASSASPTNTNRTTMSWKTKLANVFNKVFSTEQPVNAESIAAVNSELQAEGVTEAVVMLAADVAAAADAAQQVQTLATANEQLNSQVTSLSQQVTELAAQVTSLTEARDAATAAQTAAQEQVNTLTTQLSEANARIEQLENEPGDEGKPSGAVRTGGDKDPANTAKDPREYAHNVAVREIMKNL